MKNTIKIANKNILNDEENYRKIFKSVIDSFKIEGLILPEETAREIAKKVEEEFKIPS